MIDLDTLKDILTSFGHSLFPDMEDDELENIVEEYMDSDVLLKFIDTPYNED